MQNIILSSPPEREIILEQQPLVLNINVCLCFGFATSAQTLQITKMKRSDRINGQFKHFPESGTHLATMLVILKCKVTA